MSPEKAFAAIDVISLEYKSMVTDVAEGKFDEGDTDTSVDAYSYVRRLKRFLYEE